MAPLKLTNPQTKSTRRFSRPSSRRIARHAAMLGCAIALVFVPWFSNARAADQWHDSHDDCAMCHTQHFSQSHTWSGIGAIAKSPQPDGDWLSSLGPNPSLLKTSAATDQLCRICHKGPPPAPTVQALRIAHTGTVVAQSVSFIDTEWDRSPHANTPASPLRSQSSAMAGGTCANCHNPHGVADTSGEILGRLLAREPKLCTACHDNQQSGDIASQLTRPFVHGQLARGTHDPAEGGDPSKFGTTPVNNRHVTCSDCHNSHAGPLLTAAGPPTQLSAVERVGVINGSAGTVPTYVWHEADDGMPVFEYEVCFKCHSSWTTQPAGQTDLALVTNPANPSFHPIQDRGRNERIDPASFTVGFSTDTILACSDCHRSDDPYARGTHASANEHLLAKPSPSSTDLRAMQKDDLCFSCHAFAVYADATSTPEVEQASRFNAPAADGHAFHVGAQQIACYSCHETHGSTRYPALIARRMPGILDFTQTASGGTCLSTCHPPRTYTLNYPR